MTAGVPWFNSGNISSGAIGGAGAVAGETPPFGSTSFGPGSGGNNNARTTKINMKDAVRVLYPSSSSRQSDTRSTDRSRFSPLLLEHGEKHLQDWAVMAYTSPTASAGAGPVTNMSGDSSSAARHHGGTSTPSNISSNRNRQVHIPETTWAARGPTPQQSTKHNRSPSASAYGSSSSSSSRAKRSPHDKDSYPTAHWNKIEGRLHLCSHSLVFEPTDISRPIVRCSFNKMEAPPKEYPNKSDDPALLKSFEAMTVEFESSRHITMKPNNSISPFQVVPVHTLFRFTFLHSSPSSLVDLCQKLFTIWHNVKSAKSGSGGGKGSDGKTHHHQQYHGNHLAIPELQELLRPMMDRPFDPTNLIDVRERPETSNIRCHLLSPLQEQPGCMVITQERLYFQPALGIISVETTPKATSWSLSKSLVATARRYHGLKDSGLELFWRDNTSSLFAFERKHEREQVLRLLPTVTAGGVTIPCHTDRDFILQASREWQDGKLTNYEYLLLLNSAGGRTLQDLSRYPVFPWVISDYQSPKLDLSKAETYRDLTKPMGALNPKRLEYFKTRYESMADDMDNAFLYGTHYSAAGYVLYYLVRSMPEHMLCLQNGKFDSPDRLFHSIAQTHSCALSNHADVKELIPEFFYNNAGGSGSGFDFLINVRGLQLGATQNGDRVNDVTLPPWAKSPRDFLRKNAKALESDICTSMLPRWIDLIFGSKSRGEAAKESNNLFHKSAYLGPSDLSAMPTPAERFQAELQATEFGIVPDQLFVGPHPLKHETVDDSFVNSDIGGRITFSGTEDGGKADAWELLELGDGRQSSGDDQETQDNWGNTSSNQDPAVNDPVLDVNRDVGQHHLDSISPFVGHESTSHTAIPMSGSGELQAKPNHGSSFSYLRKEATQLNVSASSDIINQVSSQLSPISVSSPAGTMQPTSSEWDIKFIEKGRAHDEAVSGCAMLPLDHNRSLLVTTSLDGGLKVQTLDLGNATSPEKKPEGAMDAVGGITSTLSRYMNRHVSTVEKNKLSEFRSHTSRDPLACLSVAMDNQGGKVAFAGGHDDVVLAYGINSACAVASVYSHRDAVTGLDMLQRPPVTLQSALWSKNSTHIMVSGSWDATIKVWSVVVANGETVSIDREPIAELFDADSPIVCVSAATIPDDGGIVVAAGSADGSFCVWALHGDGVQVVIHKEPAKRGSGPCSVIKWSSQGGKLTLFTGFNTGKVASYSLVDGSMRRASVASVGVAVQSLVYAEGILLIGCADGGLRLIPIRDHSYFTQDLSLWPSINNKNSPGLSSLTLSFSSGKCICCTGGEDGTVAIFELKRALR